MKSKLSQFQGDGFSNEQIEVLRNETDGCKHIAHFNNAGASLMPKPVYQAIVDHIGLENEIGGYEASHHMEKEINKFYSAAARLLNCRPDNIAFTSNATDSFNRSLSSITFSSGDIIVTTNEDYASNQIAFLSMQKRLGIQLIRAKSLPEGGVDLEDIERLIVRHHPKLIAVTHIPTNSPLVQPVEEIGILCEKYDILYLLDACQSAGQLPLDTNKLKCDFLSITARKFLRGPRGAGFLFVSDKVLNSKLEPLFIDLRGADWVSENSYIPRKDAKRFEDWEFAYALLLGTKAAIEYYLNLDAGKVTNQIKYLSEYLRNALQQLPGIAIYDSGKELSSSVTFHAANLDPAYIQNFLLERKVNVAISWRKFAFIDLMAKKVEWLIRASPHYYNTQPECDMLLEGIRELTGK